MKQVTFAVGRTHFFVLPSLIAGSGCPTYVTGPNVDDGMK